MSSLQPLPANITATKRGPGLNGRKTHMEGIHDRVSRAWLGSALYGTKLPKFLCATQIMDKEPKYAIAVTQTGKKARK